MLAELIVGLLALTLVASVGLLLLKLVFTLVLLPVKLVFFLTKGLLALVVGIPLLVLGGVLLAASFPLLLLLVALPVCLLGGLALALVH